ncbi:elongation factor G-like protein EF-G2 [Uniformispora flossi]|uniref:elongation factor G-like protein EF-G2 n=1 Tax=Uniformispora flossi TaxID=3390723 RepID=UPI003C2F5D40
MADKSGGATGAAGAGPAVDGPGSVRNVVLVGHTGAGKTTLVESLLVATGTISRPGRVEDGTTVSDFDDIEHRQHRSVSLSLAPVEFGGVKINLLDTPGYADFVGDLRAGLRAADAALFVVSAADGVDGSTRMLWDECAAVGMPRAIVVTKLDSARADFDEMTAICQRVFGDGDSDRVLPLYLPLHDDDSSVAGLLGLLTKRVYDYSSGSRETRDPEPEHLPLIDEARNRLIEAVIAESEDETLMDRYLGGEEIDVDTLVTDLETAVARGSFYPVLASSTANGLGTVELLEGIVRACPSPPEHDVPAVTTPEGKPHAPLTCDPEGPLVAEVVKTTSDPYVGRISLVRVFSGTLRPDMTVHVSGHGLADRGHEDHDVDEKVGALSSPLGKTQRQLGKGIAGDVVAVAKLTRAETGDTLSDKDTPLLMEPWIMPDPLLPVAIEAHSKADEDKLSQGLSRLVAEDPTLRLEHNPDTRQLVLWCMGEAHVDVLLDRLRSRYGVAVDAVPHKVSLRETFAAKAPGRGRHVKQSGGHGQFAVCEIEVEPLENGAGFEFVDKVYGGSVPRQFIPSVEKGVRAQMAKGVVAGYPVVDLRVTLVDGKAHSVDSSDMAFQMAGALALREAAAAAEVHLLEPVSDVQIIVSDEYVGSIMSDLSSRRGRVVGTEPVGTGRTLVRAEVPEIEISRYAIDLRSLSHGTGEFSRAYVRHEPMPTHMAAKVKANGHGA